jgi:hypothetical protein
MGMLETLLHWFGLAPAECFEGNGCEYMGMSDKSEANSRSAS